MRPATTIQEYLDGTPRHARVIGPPGSGKTTLLIERWRALSAHGHRPGVVSFGHEHRARLLERLIPPGGAHLGAQPVTTHALVASAVLDAARPARVRTLREVDEMLVLARLLRGEPALLTSDLSAISASATFIKDILRAIHALAQHGIATTDARDCARRCKNPRARDVLAVYARYRERCGERGLVSFYDMAWCAAEKYEAGGIVSPLAPFDVVLIDDFHDLDPGQYRLLTRLLPPDGATAIEVFGDPTGARFSFRGTSDRYFQERFSHDYVTTDLEVGVPPCADVALGEVIAHLITGTRTDARDAPQDNGLPLFANAATQGTLTSRPQWPCTATLVLAADEIAEAQTIAARAREATDAGVTPREIAIVTRDLERYRGALHMACYEHGVPLEAGAHENGAAEDFLRSLLGALGSDPDGRFAEALATSPFYPSLADGREVKPLIRTLKHDHTRGGAGLDVERLLSDRVVPVLARGDSASHNTLTAVVEEWQRYNEVIAHAGGGASLDEFRSTYLAERTGGVPGANRVQLLSARESTGRTFHTTFVCGAAEGFFPGTIERDGYIALPALARAIQPVNADAAHDIAVRLDEAAVERAESALFLTALTRSTTRLVITTPARIAGESALPANVLTVGERPFATQDAERGVSPCARAAGAVAHAAPHASVAQKLRVLDTLAGWWVSPAPPERFPALGEFSMSASKLNSYARCERQFFYRKVLNMNEPTSIYLRAGSLVHEALREIIPVGATGDEVRAALQHAGTREIAERLVSDAMKEEGTWTRELSVTYLEEVLRHVSELEAQRTGDYRVRIQEEKAEIEVEGMPLSGRFDRIDDVEGLGPVIIDYKTSANINKMYSTLIEKIESEYWQIPVYAVMAVADYGDPAAFVYYALPPGGEGFASGVQLTPGKRPAPIPLASRGRPRYGPVDAATIAAAMARAVDIHRSIIDGDCRYERTTNTSNCPKCHFARICQRSSASL